MVKKRRRGHGWQPAQLMLSRLIERLAEASQKERCTQLVGLAACCLEELNRGIERRDDFQRHCAFFSHLAMDGFPRVLPRLQPAPRKKEPSLVHDASYPLLVVEDDCICRIAPLIALRGLAVAKALGCGHGGFCYETRVLSARFLCGTQA